MKRLSLTLIFLSLATLAAEWNVEVLPVPNTISGTLTPLSIAVNERIVVKKESKLSTLYLNGRKIDGDPGFFFSTPEGRLDFKQARHAPSVLKITLPRLLKASVEGGQLVLKVSPDTARLMLEDLPISLKRHIGRIRLPKDEKWLANAHAVRVFHKSEVAQLYNLTFSKRTAPVEKPRPVAEEAKVVEETAPAPTPELTSDKFDLFYLGGLVFTQSTGGKGYSASASWAPRFALAGDFQLQFELGALALKKVTSGLAMILDYEALLGLSMDAFTLGAGGGGQTWIKYGGTRPVASARLGLSLDDLKELSIDQIVVGYTAVFDTNFTHFIRLGATFSF